ncbi:MFS transporter, partial [Pseudomonas putida]|nr:MFS transporter [Pseudomonas putida]
VFGLLMALCLASGGLVLCWLREPDMVARSQAAPEPAASALRSALVWRLALGTGLLCAPQVALISFGGIFLHEVGQASLLLMSVLLTLV